MELTKSAVEQEIGMSVTPDLDQDKQNKRRQMQEDALNSLASELSTEFIEFVGHKERIEDRWMRDVTQYHGKYFQDEDLGFNEETLDKSNRQKRSNLFVNVTRSKTDSAEARTSDMLFPSDDKNWDIRATPSPEMAEALKNNNPVQLQGQELINAETSTEETPVPMTEGDIAKEEMADIKTRAEKMSTQIEDQFIECKYPAQARLAIRDACQLGTGILKGPMQVGRTRKVWVPKLDTTDDTQVHVLEIQEIVRPYVYRVDPWNFFPDMTAGHIDDCEKTFEIHYKTKKQMKELLKTPGYIEAQVRRVLEQEPNKNNNARLTSHLEQLRALAGIQTGAYQDNRYRLIEYHGPINKNILIELGVELDEDDPLDCMEGFVWFVDDVVVKIAVHHLDSEDKLYSLFNWEKDDASVFGYGVPYTMRAPQKVISAAWRMIMDNSGLSTGPQIVVNRGTVTPADGSWELTPRKVWYAMEEDVDVTKAFVTFNIDSHQQELLQIFYEAKKLAEEETNLPMVSQGMGSGAANRTFSGMSMQMNASNITLKRAVKNWDDDITIPILTRMYDWNMQFNPDNSIKGDFEVHARGTGALLVKELQSQGLLQMMQYAAHPVFGPLLRVENMMRMTAKSLYVDHKEIVKDDDTIAKEAKEQAAAAQEGPQVSPDVQMKTEAQLQIAQMNQQGKEAELEYKYAQLERQTEELLTQLAQEQELTIADIETKYEIELGKQDWDAQKFYDELDVKRKQGTGI